MGTLNPVCRSPQKRAAPGKGKSAWATAVTDAKGQYRLQVQGVQTIDLYVGSRVHRKPIEISRLFPGRPPGSRLDSQAKISLGRGMTAAICGHIKGRTIDCNRAADRVGPEVKGTWPPPVEIVITQTRARPSLNYSRGTPTDADRTTRCCKPARSRPPASWGTRLRRSSRLSNAHGTASNGHRKQ